MVLWVGLGYEDSFLEKRYNHSVTFRYLSCRTFYPVNIFWDLRAGKSRWERNLASTEGVEVLWSLHFCHCCHGLVTRCIAVKEQFFLLRMGPFFVTSPFKFVNWATGRSLFTGTRWSMKKMSCVFQNNAGCFWAAAVNSADCRFYIV